MKRRSLALFLCLLMALTLAACGPGEEASQGDPSQNSNGESSGQEKQPENSDSQYYFKDGTLVAEDVKIVITDWKVIPVGDPGNAYGEKPVIAFWYDTTNTTQQDIDMNPTTAWIAMFTAIQDNNPNAVNELDIGSLPDDTFLDSQMESIKKGGTVPNAVSYELDDATTPVILKATKGYLGESLGEQTFEIAE